MAINKQDLIERIQNLEALSNEDKSALIGLLREHKKYGLVWEHKLEDAELYMRDNLPVLTEDVTKAVKSNIKGSPNHILIEGDNLYALTALNYTHAGKIDLIYIDPPYNTGAKNWKYNNDFVDKEDGYRHSKFISFMHNRLNMAKRLLSESGIIICAIDDYEIHDVRMLMDEIFGEDNRLGTIVVVHNPRGRNDDEFIATMHEYLLVYALDSENAEIGYFSITEEEAKKEFNKQDEISAYGETSYIRTGNNSLRVERPGLWYEIYYNPETDSLSLEKTSEQDVLLLPINGKDEERCWRWGPDTFLAKKDTELFVKKVKGEYKIYKKRRLTDMPGRKPKTVWADSKYDASSNGIMLLQDMFDGKNPFPYPKSIEAVYDCLLIGSKKDSIILDFFAGSGTTLHATMRLNAADGGHRQCILVTNNENNICEEVTYLRNKKAILGYTTPKGKSVEGLFNNNLRYYKTSFVGRKDTNKNRRELMMASTDLLKIKNDIYEEKQDFLGRKLKTEVARYFEDGRTKMLVIYDERAVLPIVDLIRGANFEGRIIVYVFSNSRYAYEDEFIEIADKVTLCAIPSAIYEAYKRVLKPVVSEDNGIVTSSIVDGYPQEVPEDGTLFQLQ